MRWIVLRRAGRALWVFALLVALPAHAANAPAYHVTKIIDGDTFDATDGTIHFRVRIAGMDAPEKGSPFSKQATFALQQKIANTPIEIHSVGRGLDMYNRVLGQVVAGGHDVGIALITMGLATYYRPGCVDYPANKSKYNYDPTPYITAEQSARAQHLGMWSDVHTVLPCVVRRGRE